MANPELFEQDFAAKYLGVKPATLSAWRVRDHGPNWLKIGRLVKYSREDLDAYLAASTHRPVARRAHPSRVHVLHTVLGGA